MGRTRQGAKQNSQARDEKQTEARGEAGRLESVFGREGEVGRGTQSRTGLESGGRRAGAAAARERPTDPVGPCFPP